jgi:hypothetical protein
MPTPHDEKPTKPRQRSRKPDQRNLKGEQKAEVRPDSGPVSPIVSPIEAAAIETAPVEAASVVIAVEAARDAALSGEVLPPQVRAPASLAAGLPAIAQAYGDYTRKSWTAGRFLVERLVAARSFDEAVEIQGEFAKQAYANFVAQSGRICELYGEWSQQLFRPFEKLAADWTRGGR